MRTVASHRLVADVDGGAGAGRRLIIRDVRVMGFYGGHCEVQYDDVRVPENHLLGPRGAGFKIAQRRLGPGRAGIGWRRRRQ